MIYDEFNDLKLYQLDFGHNVGGQIILLSLQILHKNNSEYLLCMYEHIIPENNNNRCE